MQSQRPPKISRDRQIQLAVVVGVLLLIGLSVRQGLRYHEAKQQAAVAAKNGGTDGWESSNQISPADPGPKRFAQAAADALAARPPLTLRDLQHLEAHWREQGAMIVDHLRPGLTDTQIDALTRPAGIRLTGESRTWFKWHDGASRGDVHALIELYPLEQAVKETQFERTLWPWRSDWLAFGQDAGGSVWYLDAAGPVSRVGFQYESEDPAWTTARSMGGMVRYWNMRLDRGWLRLHDKVWDTVWYPRVSDPDL